jgi:DNA-binding MarR family transcriptional regulator
MHKTPVMKSDPSREEREVSYYILDYLSDNPDAGDTLEGILQWWLLTRSIKFELRTVSDAVASLVAEGLIVEEKGPDSRSIYRIRKIEEDRQKILDKLKEIRSSLDD